MEESLEEVRQCTTALAIDLGLEESSLLDKGAHESLAAQVQKLAATDAFLKIKSAATTSALISLAAEMDERAARPPGAGAVADDPPPEQMDVPYFLDDMESKVASAMEGADQKAVESQMYKDVMKSIAAPDESDDDDIVVPNDNKVSLKCPINLTTMVDPMKSKVCGHTYGKQAILNVIRVGSKKGAVSCPVAACSHKVARADLVPDKDMERRLRIESNTQHSEEPMDDAELIDDDDDNVRATTI
ncbi:unnamed protein product [Pylaiella littoralis]